MSHLRKHGTENNYFCFMHSAGLREEFMSWHLAYKCSDINVVLQVMCSSKSFGISLTDSLLMVMVEDRHCRKTTSLVYVTNLALI